MRTALLSFSIRCSVLLFGCCIAAQAQTVDDFVRAGNSSEPGCDAIPYPDLQSACKSKRDDVTGFCKTEERSCAELDTFSVLKKVEDTKQNLSTLERARDNARSKRDSAKDDSEKRSASDEVTRIEGVIEQKKRSIEEQQKIAENYKYMATGRIAKADYCVSARKAAMSVFETAKSRASGQRANTDTDPAIRTALEKSLALFTAADSGHANALVEVNNLRARCEKSQRGEQW